MSNNIKRTTQDENAYLLPGRSVNDDNKDDI